MIRSMIWAGLFVLLLGGQGRAGYIVTVETKTMTVGTSGTVDVLIRHDGVGPSDLHNFQLGLLIESPGTTRLRFTDPQADLQLGDPDYVFFGNSGFSPPLNVISTTTNPGDTATVGDLSSDFIPVPISALSPRLLARLEIEPVTGPLSPHAGESFTIRVTANTYFDDGNFTNSIAFTPNPGVITFQDASAVVPGPSSLVMLLGAGTTGLFGGWLRRRGRGHR